MLLQTSVFSHAPISAPLELTVGRDAIHKRLGEEGTEVKFSLVSADIVPSIGGCVMIMVQGKKLTKESTNLFYHTFLLGLVASSQAYYIHNDIMKICDREEVEEDEEDEEEEEEDEEAEVETEPAVVVRSSPAAPAAAPAAAAAAASKQKPAAAAAAPAAAAVKEAPAQAAAPAPTPAAPAAKKEKKQQAAAAEAEAEIGEKPTYSSWASMFSHIRSSAPASDAKVERVVGGIVPNQGTSKKPHTKKEGGKGGKKGAGKGAKGGDRGAEGKKDAKEAAAAALAAAAAAASAAGKGEKGEKGAVRRERRERDVNYSYHSLYVSYLPESFKESDIDEVFGQFGEIKGKTFQVSYCLIVIFLAKYIFFFNWSVFFQCITLYQFVY